MKLLILTLCVAGALARPDVSHLVNSASSDQAAQILKQEQEINPDGSYKWSIETDNGISAHEHGEPKNVNSENAAESVGGAAGWTSPEGEKVELHYTADETGYHPEGSHIPTPPPIPEAIIRALEYIRAHPPAPEK